MKTIFMLALTIATFAACTKDNNNSSSLYNRYAGKWELAQTTGFVVKIYPPGNGNYIMLQTDGSFSRLQHDTLLLSTTYNVQEKYDDCSKQNLVLFTSSDSALQNLFIDIKNNELTFTQSYCIPDARGYTYRKIF
jgi:hypothetical protein